MNFVNGDWRFKPICLPTVLEPSGIVPLMRFEIGDDGAGVGAQLRVEAVGIGFEREKISVWADELVFIDGAFGDFGKEKFPDARRAARTHGVDTAVPVIHITNDADATSGWRPDGEVRAGDTGDGAKVCAEFLVSVKVAALADEMEIEIGEEKRKGVGIENFKRFVRVGAALDFVAARFGSSGLIGGPNGFEEAFGAELNGVGDFCGRDGGIFKGDAGFGGPRNEKADRPSGADGMRTEKAERVGVLSREEGVDASIQFGVGALFWRERG